MTPEYQDKLIRYVEADAFLDGLIEAYRVFGKVSTKMEMMIEAARDKRKIANFLTKSDPTLLTSSSILRLSLRISRWGLKSATTCIST